MTKFFHFYEDKSAFDNVHHKAQFLSTSFMPLIFLVLAFLTYFSTVLSSTLIGAISTMYLIGIVRSIVLAVQKKAVLFSPLMISALSGPVYFALLYFVDPSLVGIPGLLLIVGVPAVLLVPLLINHLKKTEFDDYSDDEYDEDEQFTEEIDKVA